MAFCYGPFPPSAQALERPGWKWRKGAFFGENILHYFSRFSSSSESFSFSWSYDVGKHVGQSVAPHILSRQPLQRLGSRNSSRASAKRSAAASSQSSSSSISIKFVFRVQNPFQGFLAFLRGAFARIAKQKRPSRIYYFWPVTGLLPDFDFAFPLTHPRFFASRLLPCK